MYKGEIRMTQENKRFTEEQLNTFNRLTELMDSRVQITRIQARLDYQQWTKENNLTTKHTDAMHKELIRLGKW
jgi:hypothetical protein